MYYQVHTFNFEDDASWLIASTNYPASELSQATINSKTFKKHTRIIASHKLIYTPQKNIHDYGVESKCQDEAKMYSLLKST